MRRLACLVFGHRYLEVHHPRFFSCRRCGEPGFWVES